MSDVGSDIHRSVHAAKLDHQIGSLLVPFLPNLASLSFKSCVHRQLAFSLNKQ